MKKFKSIFCPPINFRNDDAKKRARDLREIEMKENPQYTLWAIKDGVLYKKNPPHYTGAINMRSAGGKWEKHTLPTITTATGRARESIKDFLVRINAIECSFRGGPRA